MSSFHCSFKDLLKLKKKILLKCVQVKNTVMSSQVWSTILIHANEPTTFHQVLHISANVDTIKRQHISKILKIVLTLVSLKGSQVPPAICGLHFENHQARLSVKYRNSFKHLKPPQGPCLHKNVLGGCCSFLSNSLK